MLVNAFIDDGEIEEGKKSLKLKTWKQIQIIQIKDKLQRKKQTHRTN
jgi:hypothetical protein